MGYLLERKKVEKHDVWKKHPLPSLQLEGKNIDWVEKWTYLGITVVSHNCCIEEKVKSFYRSANAILRIEGRSNDLVMLQLLEAHCVSILSYGIEVLHVANADTRRKLRVAYNLIFRRVFGYRMSESVSQVQHALGRPTWEELVEKIKAKFLASARKSTLLNQFL